MLAFTRTYYFNRFSVPIRLGAPWFDAVWALIFVFLTTGSALAQQSWLKSDVQLRGEQAAHSTAIYVAGVAARPVQIEIPFAISSMVDRSRSLVNILVNGQILSTRKLSDVKSDTLTIQLRPLAPGRHELIVQAYLRGREPDCLPFPEALWMTLLSTSTIQGASIRSAPEEILGAVVRDFPGVWRNGAAQRAPSLPDGTKQFLSVSVDHSWGADTAAAIAQAQVYFARQGFELRTHSAASGLGAKEAGHLGSLAFRDFDRLEPNHPARARWALSAATKYVLYTATSNRLEIITKGASGISEAIELLADDELRPLCHESICGTQVRAGVSTDAAKSILSQTRSDLLWALGAGDRPRGWTAKGPGVHQLRQIWVRPVTLSLRSAVELQLVARASQAAQVDPGKSSISLRINDQALATYSLSAWKSSHASIRIPESVWAAPVWVIDFEVRLTPVPQERCSFLAKDDLWVAIDPQTRLNAKFEHVEPGGIAGFWLRGVNQPLVKLTWRDKDRTHPSLDQLTSIVPFLQGLVGPSADPAGPRWAFSGKAGCEEKACLVLHPPRSSSTDPAQLLHWQELVAAIPKPAARMPDLTISDTAVIVWSAPEGTSQEQLHIIWGPHTERGISAPPLSTFAGPIAVHTDQWRVLASTRVGDQASATQPPGSGNTSQQQTRLRWVNLIWALLSVTIIVIVASVYWRKKRQADPKTWEVS
jgi:hypothetical protein